MIETGKCSKNDGSFTCVIVNFVFEHLVLSISDSGENYLVTVKDVKISPDPAVRGGDAIFDIPAVTSMKFLLC